MPAICVKCKHHSHYEGVYHYCSKSWAKTRNFVTGKMDTPIADCEGMNKDGNCSHFEPKVPLWSRFIAWLT